MRVRRFRRNWQIRASPVRLLDEKGRHLGIVELTEARAQAAKKGLDLVEISPNAKPPVVRIVDWGKFKYELAKKLRQQRKKIKRGEDYKEIKLSPFIGQQDLQTRVNHGLEFLREGKRLKVVVKFRGRQITKKEFGWRIFAQFADAVAEVGEIERQPKLIGRQLIGWLKPKK